jgi:spermidine synthase
MAMQHGIRRQGSRLVVHEWLNPRFGFFYTARRRLYRGRSRFQRIDLLDADEFGATLLLDGVTQVATGNDFQYHEPMVHPALTCHPRPSEVLIIGGGDGGILREVLKHPGVRRVVVVELDQEVVAFSRKYLPGLSRGAFGDPRVQLRFMDGRVFVEENPASFDVVIMDMTDPSGPSRMLYTREFFGLVKRSFRNASGIFVMHGESPVSRPHAYACVQRTLRSTFRHVRPLYAYIQMYATLWSINLSSDGVDAGRFRAAALDRRLAARHIHGLKMYSGATHLAMLVPFPYIEMARRRMGRVITDRSPDFSDNIHGSR